MAWVLTGQLGLPSSPSWAQLTWTQTNGPYGGDIRKVVFSPSGNAYALSYAGRIYRSTDDGNSWRELTTDIGGLSVSYVAVDSAGNVYAAASDVHDVTSQVLIYRSTNGDRWTYLGTVPTQKQILTLGINAAGHLYAGTGGTTIFPAEGPFRSTNGGTTWNVLAIGSKPDALLDIVFPSSGKIFALGGRGLYCSSDNGQTWTNIWSGNGSSLALNSSDYLFIGTSFASYPGVFRSTDEGGTWSPVDSGLSSLNVRCLAINNASTLFAGTEHGIFASRDNGDSWSAITAAQITDAVQSIAINSRGYLLAGTFIGSQVGIFRSTDAGSTWYKANTGLTNIGVISLAVDRSGRVYAAGQYFGLWGSSDKGNSWADLGLANQKIMAVATDQLGRLFAGSSDKVFRSTDAGTTWHIAVIDEPIAPFVRVFAFDSSGHLFAGTYQGVFRSVDNGETWQKTNNGLTELAVRSLAVLANGDILAGTAQGLFRSTNDGDLWAPSGITTDGVGSIAVSPNRHLFATTAAGVVRSIDDAVSWKTVNVGLPRPTPSGPNIPIGHLAVNSHGTVFAAVGNLGVYSSTNDGESWAPVNDGLTDPTVWALCVDPSGYLFAGTAGSGIYRTLQSTVTSVAPSPVNPETFILEQNYPNPFNPTTAISYQLAANSFVTLRIFDVLGREVAKLVNEQQAAGTHDVRWDASGMPSGMYLYRITAGNFDSARKMVLTK